MPGSIQMRGSMNMRGAIVPSIYMGISTPQSQDSLTRYDSQNAEEKGKEKYYTSPTSVLEGPGVSPISSRCTWSPESSGEPITLRSQIASRRIDFSVCDPSLSDDEDVNENGNQPVKKQKIDKEKHFEVSSFPARRLTRGKRIYDSLLGRTCHWCRQKTVEDHVICSTCPIQFCGPCLLNRHGEHILEEMQEDVNWVCPRCRGGCGPGCSNCCNCGPCRRAQGLPPTGQLVKEARGAGFTNVHDFLVAQSTGECQEQLFLRKVGRNWTVDPNNAISKYREPKKLNTDWNPSQFQRSQTETQSCGQIGISTVRMRGAISSPFMKNKFHIPSACSGAATASFSQLPDPQNQNASDNSVHSSESLISDDKKTVSAIPISCDRMNLTVKVKHGGVSASTDFKRSLVDTPDVQNPHSQCEASSAALPASLPTYNTERGSRFEDKTAIEKFSCPGKKALDRKVTFVGVKHEASCLVGKAFGTVTESTEEIAEGSSRIQSPNINSLDLPYDSFASSATPACCPLVKGQVVVESRSAKGEQKVAIKRLDDSAPWNAEGMCSGNENQGPCKDLQVNQLSEENVDLSENINTYSNGTVQSLFTVKTETRTSSEVAASTSIADNSDIVTISEPSITSRTEDGSGQAHNLTVLTKATAENITKKEKMTEKISVPGMKESTEFSQRLRAAFGKPFNMHELAELWEQITHHKPVTRQRETRQGSFEVTTSEEGLSYLDHHPDLRLKLSTTVDPEVKLQMLRGFFCWLQCACLAGAFKPWVDSKHSSFQDEDCSVTDGPDCEIIAVVLSLDDDQALSMRKTDSCATRSKQNYDRKHDMEPNPNVSSSEVIADKIEDIKPKLDQNMHFNAQVVPEIIEVVMDDQAVSVSKTSSSESRSRSNFDGKNKDVEPKLNEDMTSSAGVIVEVEVKAELSQHAYPITKVISGNVEVLVEELEDVKPKLNQKVNSNPQGIALANVQVICLDDDEIKPILDQDAVASAKFFSKDMTDSKPRRNQDISSEVLIDNKALSVSTTSSSHSGSKRNIYGKSKDIEPKLNVDMAFKGQVVDEVEEVKPKLTQHAHYDGKVLVEEIEHVKPKLDQEVNSIAQTIVEQVKDIRPANVPVICLDDDEIRPILDVDAASNPEFLSKNTTGLSLKSNEVACPEVQVFGHNLGDGKPKLLKPKHSCYLAHVILIDDEEITPKLTQEKARLKLIANVLPSQVILVEDEDHVNSGSVKDFIFVSKPEPICHSNFEGLCC